MLFRSDLDRAEAWFDGRGESAVFFGRLIPLLRSFVSLAAGLAEMAKTKFAVLTVLGCAIWCAALAAIGYSLGSSWHRVIKDFSFASYIVAALAVAAIVFVAWHRLRTIRRERSASGAMESNAGHSRQVP